MKFIWAVLLLAAPCLGASTTDEASLSAQLTIEAEKFLESLLGPGRSRILVTVEGERTESRSQKELSTPVEKPDSSSLPGYAQEKPRVIAYTITSQEHNAKSSGFTVKRVRAVALIDRAVAKELVDEANRVLPQVLLMDFERGDELTMVRSDLMPPWKSMLSGPEGLRAAVLLGGSLGLLLLAGLMLHATAMRAVRVFVSEMASRRDALPAPMERGEEGLGGEGLPDLLEGEIPGMMGEGRGGTPALGRRFDFLAGRSAVELSRLLEKENAEDLALLFAHLAESDPALAGAAFAALEPARQTGASQALARLTSADPEKLSLLESRLRTAVDFGVQGAERLGSILSRLPQEQREGLLGEVAAADPAAAGAVEKALFAFEDIAALKPQEMRRLIVAVPYEEWGVALRGSSQQLYDQVAGLLLEGPREMVRAARETPQPKAKVLEARSKVVAAVRALEQKGLIASRQESAAGDVI